jgi:hypothetical protein
MRVNIVGERPSPVTNAGNPLQISNSEKAEPDELRCLLFFLSSVLLVAMKLLGTKLHPTYHEEER